MQDFFDKLIGAATSRRFLALIVGAVMVLAQDTLGMTEDQVQTITSMIMSWIVGDSLMKTDRFSFRVKANRLTRRLAEEELEKPNA